MIKRFFPYYKPHKKLFILDLIASFLVSLIGMIYPMITREMLNDIIPNQNIRMVFILGGTLLVLYVIRMLLKYFIQYYGHMMGVRMQAQMREEMFHKLQQLPYSYYDEHESGKIMSRMTNDLMDISELAHHGPENIFISGVMIIGSFIYLCTINVSLTLIIFGCVPLLVIVSIVLRKRMKEASRESRQNIATINHALGSSIAGIRITKAFTNSKIEEEKFAIGNKQFVESRKKAYKTMAQFFSSTSFITDIFNVIVLIAGGYFLYQNQITFGDYSAFIVSINLFINPVTVLIQFMEQYQNGVAGFERFIEIIDEPIEIENPNALDIPELKGDIEFKNVSFKYEDSKTILNNISFKLTQGKTLALVGPSGGGKTTICHLLPNFYHVTSGEILIDGHNINDITYESLRKNIGIVQQDVFLFGGTIYDNIIYGKPDATYEEVVEAAKMANIYDYIMTLPDKFNTEVGERGIKLSGGQKQRLSIARVFIKNPSILILDEATSALDNTTEILIQQALDKLREGRTTIVVAHRLSTIRNADEIAVITKGEIIEKGSHEKLIQQNGIYATLYKTQFRDSDNDLQQLM